MAVPHAQPQGYHRLAELMGNYPEAAIFRCFRSLNMLHLLSLQAELIDLQVEFRDICNEDDVSSDMDEKQFSTWFMKLRRSDGGVNDFQYKKLGEIRTKLTEYSKVIRLPEPEEADVKFLRDWLAGDGEGGDFLQVNEAFTWRLPKSAPEREHRLLRKDFVTLRAPIEEQDVFSKILSSHVLDLWNSIRSYFDSDPPAGSPPRFQKSIDPDSGIMRYSDSGLLRFNNVLVSVIGSILPVVAIVALYFIKTDGGRIGAMAGFTVAFALTLALFTNARRLEITASTAAFAAVEVVFIGSNLGNNQGQ